MRPPAMLIWILVALMTAALLAAVLRPLLAVPSVQGHVLSSVDVYHAQLAELEVEKTAGRVAEAEYQAARALENAGYVCHGVARQSERVRHE